MGSSPVKKGIGVGCVARWVAGNGRDLGVLTADPDPGSRPFFALKM